MQSQVTHSCAICHASRCHQKCHIFNQQLNEIAKGYVQLVLGIGEHHPLYVDAYYGTSDWRNELTPLSLSQLQRRCEQLADQLKVISMNSLSQALLKRRHFLAKQLKSVQFYLRQAQGESFCFTEQSTGLYDACAPKYTLTDFADTLEKLRYLLPGEGSLAARFEQYRQSFIVPTEKVPLVFAAAVEHARKLTHHYLDLPVDESFCIKFVSDKVWTAYNWYKGGYASLIELNQDQPMHIERALALASHEGYPGHHVFNLLQERELVRGLGWFEYAIYPLYSPISFLSEGSANYGLNLIMSADEVVTFERDVLMPLAGLSGDLNQYHRVMGLYKQLAYLDNLVCQQLIDGEIDDKEAAAMLVEYGLYTESKARQRVGFYLANQSYVINYNFGEDSVGYYVEAGAESLALRW